MEAITRAFEAKIDDVKADDRSIVAKINTSGMDRHKTVILPRGGALENYRKNPVVLWEHGQDPARGRLPIGKNQWIKTTDDAIVAKTMFRDDDYSRMLWEAYRDEDLRGWSVMALPSEGSPPTIDEIARSVPKECQFVYRAWELGEYSGVAVPSNPDTLSQLVARGLWIPSDARTMTDSMGGMAAGGAAIEPQEVPRYIRKKGSKYVVYSESGKVLGTHPDRASAEKQLAAIEAHKHDESRSGRYVASQGDSWLIFEANGQPIDGCIFPDRRMAERCLAAMASPVSWSEIHDRMAAEQQSRNLGVMEDVKAILELALLGRV